MEEEKEQEKSEFGKGCTYCLVLFASHFNNDSWQEIELYSRAIKDKKKEHWGSKVDWWLKKSIPIYGSAEEALKDEIGIWANGASYHLYELQIPEEKGKLRNTLIELKELGLTMGHGSTGQLWTIEDMYKLREMTFEAARLLDQRARIEVVKGEWE
jgi:hypothetical protein